MEQTHTTDHTTSGLLGQVLPSAGGSTQGAIPGPDEIRRRSQGIYQARDQADLVTLSQSERAEVGDPPSLQEMELNASYAEMVKMAADLMKEIGVDPTIMPALFQMDTALVQMEDSTGQATDIGRKGTMLVAADLSGDMDLITAAADAIEVDPLTAEEDRRVVRAVVAPVEKIRLKVQDQVQGAKARAGRQMARHQQKLALSLAQQGVIAGVQTLKGSKLPKPSTGVLAKVPAKKPAGAAGPTKNKPGRQASPGKPMLIRKHRSSKPKVGGA